MQVELTRFRVRKGQEERAVEWMHFLCQNMDAVEQTLAPEKMYVETIFSEVRDGHMYLYWYSVQGQGAQPVEESEHWVDKEHLRFWHEVIDPTFPGEDLTVEVLMMLPDVHKVVLGYENAASGQNMWYRKFFCKNVES